MCVSCFHIIWLFKMILGNIRNNDSFFIFILYIASNQLLCFRKRKFTHCIKKYWWLVGLLYGIILENILIIICICWMWFLDSISYITTTKHYWYLLLESLENKVLNWLHGRPDEIIIFQLFTTNIKSCNQLVTQLFYFER